MRTGKFGGKRDMRGDLADIITEALPYDTDEEKKITDTFTASRNFEAMLDELVAVVALHVNYQLDGIGDKIIE